ncbi:DinB family protein [Flavobacterium phycosphaerae]|uniref:DinB family protein n=1 Tax=Flavobacterium phycosphaerae TaxID=2697515 RepID=UPI00138B0555|nr:DinB family protein [Flavobacterium phycosphaerae]
MKFNLPKAIEVLTRTPTVLETLLQGLSEEWIFQNEGEETWSPYDVMGHLIHGEKADWIERMEIILSDGPNKAFKPFDRFAQFEESKGKNLAQLLAEFKTLRQQNLTTLQSKKIDAVALTKKGIHPAFGEVTLEHLLATWVAHDLGHLAQIARVMAKQYSNEVGPWKEYLPILHK